LCFLFILVGIYLLAEGKVASKLRQTAFLEAQKERSDTIYADKMETRFASPQPLQLHCSPATRPRHGHPAGAGPVLQPSLFAPWPPDITVATKHKYSGISWPFVNSPADALMAI